MNYVNMMAFICPVPADPIELGKNSIVICEEDNDYLVGEKAAEIAPDSRRIYGGNLAQPGYVRLLKALTAASRGSGKHEEAIALSASHDHINMFRVAPGKLALKEDMLKILKESVSAIRFRRGSSDSEIETCRIVLKEPPKVFHETHAVIEAIPNQLKSYIVWQLGHGDVQQAVMVDSVPMRDALYRSEGIAGAMRIFESLTGLSAGQADKAWRKEVMPISGGMNGQFVSCTDEKKKAIQLYFNKTIGQMLNYADPYKKIVKNIILSGGGAKDRTIIEVLKREVESGGHYTFHTIDNLLYKDEGCEDPVFTCVNGLIKYGTLALDVGNSSLKSGVNT